jgi:hypothetical protein
LLYIADKENYLLLGCIDTDGVNFKRLFHVSSITYTKCTEILLTNSRRLSAVTTEFIFLLEMKQG